MKKTLIFSGLMLAAAFTLTNCVKETVNPAAETQEGVPFEIVAGIGTKTAVSPVAGEASAIEWKADDAINLFVAETGGEYSTSNKFTIAEADLAAGRFVGNLSSALDPQKTYEYKVVYPWKSGFKLVNASGDGNGAWLPFGSKANETQTQEGNNNPAHLAGSNMPLYGVAKGVAGTATPQIAMHQAMAVVKVHVTNKSDEPLTVETVAFSAPEGTDINGTFYIDFSGDVPTYASSGTGYTSNTANLTVTKGAEIAKDESADFYIGVLPFTVAVGAKLGVSINGTEMEKEATASTVFAAGKIKTVNVDYVPVEVAPISTDTDVVVGFESTEGFAATTQYNNTTVKYQGADGMKWGILSGSTISSAAKISGEQSMLLRDYTDNEFQPYAVTDYRLSSVAYVSFKAKTTSAGYGIKLSYSTDKGKTWSDAKTYTLTTTAEDYSFVFETALTDAAFKFTMVFPETRVNKKDVIFDDVVFSQTVPVINEITLSGLEEGNVIHIGATDGSATFIVASDDAWTATKSDDSFEISPEQGEAGETEVEVTAEDNTGAERQLGTITITNGSDTKTVYVWQEAAEIVNDGSLEHPYTASEAKTLALSGDTGSYYITGTVTKIQNQFSAKYGTANFWIDENAAAQNVFEGYKIKYIGNVDWVEGNALIEVGDVMVIYGTLTVYNTTVAETSAGYIVSWNGKTKALTVPELTATPDDSNKQITVEWGAATGSDETVTYTVTCGDQTITPAPTAAGSHTFTMADYGKYDITVAASATDAISATASTSATLTTPGVVTTSYTLTFPDDNSANNGLTSKQYESSWTATSGTTSWTITNFNNNNWGNNWEYIKCGRKNIESVATIVTDAKMSEAIKTVTLTISAVTANKINSVKLYSSSDGSSWTEEGSFTVATGDKTVNISSPAADRFYKLEFDCASGSSNGLLTLSKVVYSNN